VTTPLKWVHAPQQARSQRTMENILDAAERALLDEGLGAVTIPGVVKAAGSSVGAFYARFPDKRALLETLHQRACERSLAQADALLDPARWADASVRDLVRAGIKVAVETFGSRRNLMNAFAEAFAGDAGFAARRASTALAIGERLAALVLTRRAEIGHPQPKRAIEMALRVVTATLEQRNALAVSGLAEVSVSDAVLARELERMMAAYLEIAPEKE
jgi:AcrR family transcriptional regulator